MEALSHALRGSIEAQLMTICDKPWAVLRCAVATGWLQAGTTVRTESAHTRTWKLSGTPVEEELS